MLNTYVSCNMQVNQNSAIRTDYSLKPRKGYKESIYPYLSVPQNGWYVLPYEIDKQSVKSLFFSKTWLGKMILEGCTPWLPYTGHFKGILSATLKTFENAVSSFLDAFVYQWHIWAELTSEWSAQASSLLWWYKCFVNSAKGETVSCFQVSVEPYL